jgi:alkylation response protein AidB-like acyl-CoA dehydrogenase
MTEKDGGSDVSNATRTLATGFVDKKTGKVYYKLNGMKWFTSATESQVTITLARIVDPETGKIDAKLTAFLVKLHNKKTQRLKKTIEIIRLKEKLGANAVPTAELVLKGVKAIMLSQPGRGVSLISTLIKVCRLYSAAGSVSSMRRLVALNRDYATR